MSKVKITAQHLKKYGLLAGAERIILREEDTQYLVRDGAGGKVWIYKHECEVIE